MTAFCTLFADVSNGEVPVVISDVLVTSSGLPQRAARYEKIYIPTIGGVFPHISADSAISGLIQKLSLLPGGHCLAVAGDLSPILEFHAKLVDCGHDFEEISVLCEEFSSRISFVLLAKDSEDDRLITMTSESCRRLRNDKYGLALVGGSGESTLRKLMLQQKDAPIQGTESLSDVSKAFFLVSEALDLDSRDPSQTIEKSFGGYYEISTYDGSQFCKIDCVAYHFLRLGKLGDEDCWVLHKSFYHEYVSDDLIVRRIVWTRDEGGGIVWQDCYAIGDFHRYANMERAKVHIDETVPTTKWEVLCFEVGASKFRAVSAGRNLISLRKSEDRWFHDIDSTLMDQYAEAMAPLFLAQPEGQ
ncbi:hypothetical protein [Paraburkholderia nemoris]|uniref:Uncharacterized protein n=1 Tax=Paraburkholderia nemoris TaxID=2793076 RepID=A0ABM8SWZ7_9BURK|nr:hypothetical protein [Paraburkholderia nemoris]CAE6713178.1 hypothetical protein R75777_01221 [Paraburkholderia nemoris]CAE6838989.1 hypothetical protein R69776_06947 [Paraburkholderia nemoris]